MKSGPLLISLTVLFAVSALADSPGATVIAMTDSEIAGIPAVMVSDVQDATDDSGENEANVTLLTVFTGPVIAPFTAYLKVFDPIPQNGGDSGTFKVFKIPNLLNGVPKRLKVRYARSGTAIFVGFDAPYFDSFAANGDPKYAKGRLV